MTCKYILGLKCLELLSFQFLYNIYLLKLQIGQDQKAYYAGSSLNDDMYHTVVFKRRGTKLSAIVDEDDPVLGN